MDEKKFNHAVIFLKDNIIFKEGEVKWFKEYDNGGVELLLDNVIYYTHISNVILLNTK